MKKIIPKANRVIQWILFSTMCLGTIYTAFNRELQEDHMKVLMNSYASLGIIGISYSSLLYSLKRNWRTLKITTSDFIKTFILSCVGLVGAALFYSFL